MERPQPALLPVTPGVYLYKNAEGRIIYVGKARNLRKRVLSYFRPEATLPRKTAAMLSHAVSLDTLSTNTEKEALLLESSLIKKHRPHYNIVLRDDKQYVIFRLPRSEPFPRLEIVRQTRRDDARYFGPFTSGMAARETWKSIHRAFPLRRCTDRAFRNRVRPCLYHHLGQCLAPCTGEVRPEDYAQIVQRVELLLSGRSRELVDSLTRAMLAASETLDFEKAAQLRDQIRAVERTLERQSVVLPDGGDMDVIGVSPLKSDEQGGLGLGILFVREGRLVDGRSFVWPGLDLEDGPELVASFLGQFYGSHSAIPPRIVLPWLPPDEDASQDVASDAAEAASQDGSPDAASAPVEDGDVAAVGEAAQPLSAPTLIPAPTPTTESAAAALESLLRELRGGIVRLALPRNRAEAALVDMAAENAREAGRQRVERHLGARLAAVFGVTRPVERIECVDVSHTGGRNARVGMVVFEQEEPLKTAFRVYKLEDNAELPAHGTDNAAHRSAPALPSLAELPAFSSDPAFSPSSSDSPEYPDPDPPDAGSPDPDFLDANSPDAGNEWADEGVTPGDDYAALAAWMRRRLEAGPPWADLVLVDGGRGQVSAVYRAAREWLDRVPEDNPGSAAAESGKSGQPVRDAAGESATASFGTFLPAQPGQRVALPFLLAGIAKARDARGHADRRAGNLRDRIFVPGRSNPLALREGAPELLFLQHIRDTAHRFVIGKHRRARAKSALSGELLRLPGVGQATAKRLWDHFPNLEAMLAASEAELAAIPGIGKARAGKLAARLATLRS